MLTSMNHANQAHSYQQACETLPRISALFANRMDLFPVAADTPETRDIHWSTSQRLMRLSVTGDEQSQTACDKTGFSFIAGIVPNAKTNRNHVARQQRIVNALIAGISHHSNNILMGIWGNVSLIKLQVDHDNPGFAVLGKMEKIIQDGAYLLHLILGCAGERRMDAKRIRIKQLMNEFRQYVSIPIFQKDLEASFKIEDRSVEPGMIAASTAKVLDILLKGLGIFQNTVVMEHLDNTRILQRSGVIAALLKKGHLLTSRLEWYARGSDSPQKRVSISKLVHRQVERIKRRYPGVVFSRHITPHLPAVRVNPAQMEWVVAEIMENACAQMASGGHLRVTAKPLFAETPSERCGVHGSQDYLVISVKDNGPGMTRKQQKRILEPFYSAVHRKGSMGLGLSAADGILKNHGGFIQFRSRPGEGTCFKIYLPPAESMSDY